MFTVTDTVIGHTDPTARLAFGYHHYMAFSWSVKEPLEVLHDLPVLFWLRDTALRE